MSRGSDIYAIIRGLRIITQNLIQHQGEEVCHAWQNSSLKSAVKGIGAYIEQSSCAGFQQNGLKDAVERVTETVTSVGEDITQTGSAVRDFVTGTNRDSSFSTMNTDIENYLNEDILNQFAKSSETTTTQNTRTSGIDQFSNLNQNTSRIGVSSSQHDLRTSQMPGFHYDSEIQGITLEDLKKDRARDEDVAKDESGNSSATAHTGVKEKNRQTNVLMTDPVVMEPVVTEPVVMARVERLQTDQKLSERARERKVPGSRFGRLVSFGSLAAGLGAGALAEVTRRSLGVKQKKTDGIGAAILDSNPFLTDANAERIVNTLCRVRGAALKLGQMLSIQDSSMISPQLQNLFERVRQSADFMPTWQMHRVLREELGADWPTRLKEFNEKPFAAASIGQVHRGVLHDGREVALKIQYPGVAKSIESDINNLMGILKVWNMLPDGMYIENVMRVVKNELTWEVNYLREAECSEKFRTLLRDEPNVFIPQVIPELSTKQVLTTELIHGLPLDKCVDLPQDERDKISETLLRICLREVFEFRFMQTDPNWSNFFYNPETGQIVLLDFGSSRDFPASFVDTYIQVIRAASLGDRQGVLEGSRTLGFLTGYETKILEEAHVDAVMILGEAFAFDGLYDFSTQTTTNRIQRLVPIMLKYRLTPPPDETYSLHRKTSGMFLLCNKLSAKVACKAMFDDIWQKYEYSKMDTDDL